MQNKRGQELTVGTLILIVLGVIILVLLVLGYSMGWGSLWERINIFQGGSSLESVIQSCKVAVSSASTFTYCQDFKKVKIDGKEAYVNCEDSRIRGSVGGSLSCESNVVDNKCKELVKNAVRDKDGKIDCAAILKVNSNDCSTFCVASNANAVEIVRLQTALDAAKKKLADDTTANVAQSLLTSDNEAVTKAQAELDAAKAKTI